MKRYILSVLVIIVLGLTAVAGFSRPKASGALACSLSVNPTHASPGGSVTFTGVVTNLGTSKQKIQVSTYRIVNGQAVNVFNDSQVTLDPGASKTYQVPYTFPTNEPNPGTVSFHMQAWYNTGGLVHAGSTCTVTIP